MLNKFTNLSTVFPANQILNQIIDTYFVLVNLPLDGSAAPSGAASGSKERKYVSF